MKHDRSFPVIFCLPLTDFGGGAELRRPGVGHMTDQLTTVMQGRADK